VANNQRATNKERGIYKGVEWSHPDDYEKIEQPIKHTYNGLLVLERGKPLNVKEIETYMRTYTTEYKNKAYLITPTQFARLNTKSLQYHYKKADYLKHFFLPLQLFNTKISKQLRDKNKLTVKQFRLLICLLSFQATTKNDILNINQFKAFCKSIGEPETITPKLIFLVSKGFILRMSRESIQLTAKADSLLTSLLYQLTTSYNKYIDSLGNYFTPESL
jgi:hypothetical protein